jgi:hypothetical protein
MKIRGILNAFQQFASVNDMTDKKNPNDTSNSISTLEQLRERRRELVSRESKYKRINLLSVTISILMLIAVAALIIIQPETFKPYFPMVIVVMLYIMMPLIMIPITRMRIREIREEMQDLDFEIDLLQFGATRQEGRAEKLIHISNMQLRRYYNLNLNQNIWVFALGVFCILLGVAVIGATFYLLLKVDVLLTVEYGMETKIIIGAVGAIGSVLVNFVAAIFLKMYTKAASNLSEFHSRLVETHKIILANLVASRIEDKTKRWDTISQLSINVTNKE